MKRMQLCRDICSLAHRLRRENNLPVRLPLKELQFSGVFLPKEYQKLIKDDLNVVDINPFISKGEFDHIEVGCGENWAELKENDIVLALNIHLDDWQIKEEQEAKKRRQSIMKNKYEKKKNE
jgi:hypothetical protein